MNDLMRSNDPLFALEPMDDLFRGMLRPWRADLAARAPQIKLDVHEGGSDYTVKAEIPGVRKEDIDIRIDGNQVTISAEVKKDKEEKKDGRVLRAERQYGYASRSFSLASDVDDSKAVARYQDGVLSLTLPKKPGNGGRKLQVG